MNFGFENIVYEMPEQLIAVEKLVHSTGQDDEILARLHAGGLRRVPVSNDEPLSLLVNRAVSRLSTTIPDITRRTGGVVFTHSVPLLAPSDIPFLKLCLEGQGLDAVPRIAVSGQPCSVLHMGVQITGYWLEQLPRDQGVILIGADKAYTAKDRVFFGSAMGDVAVAAFASRETKHNVVLASISHTDIIAYEGEKSPQQSIQRFRQLNPSYIRYAIETCLVKGNVRLEDIALIMPHTPYTMIWDVVAELLRFPRERILTDFIGETGHLNSNDSFAHYVRAANENRLKRGDLVILINPGFGGTRGCTLIRH